MLAIDDREHMQDLVYRFDKLGVPAEIIRLDIGDYSFIDSEGNLNLITRKSSDLLSSVYSGHWQTEINDCVQALVGTGGGRLWYIQEGFYADTHRGVKYFGGYNEDVFVGKHESSGSRGIHLAQEISVNIVGGHVIHTANTSETIRAIARLYHKGQEGWPTSLTAGIPKRKMSFRHNPKVDVIMNVWQGCSEKKAVAILKEYGTVWAALEVMKDNPSDLTKIPGIGPKSVEKLEGLFE